MPILANLSSVFPQPTGLATYSLNLLKTMGSLPLETVSPFEITGYPWHPSPPTITPEYGFKGHLKRLLWTQSELPRIYHRVHSHLLFSPVPEAPLFSGVRYIVTVHDLTLLRFARQFSPSKLYAQYYIPAVLNQAQHVICNSEATAQDIQNFCNISASKITPIPLAHDAEQFRFLNLPTLNYFLYLGRLAPYKNVSRLISAFAALPQRKNYELWLAGPADPRYIPRLMAQVGELGLTAQVKVLSYVPYAELPKLMNQAIALVFPSLWEGFGLPVLEAMACGTPVITSNLASLPEVAGEATLLVDPYDAGAIAEAMQALITDHQLWVDLRQAGLARASQFSWQKTGQATAEILKHFL